MFIICSGWPIPRRLYHHCQLMFLRQALPCPAPSPLCPHSNDQGFIAQGWGVSPPSVSAVNSQRQGASARRMSRPFCSSWSTYVRTRNWKARVHMFHPTLQFPQGTLSAAATSSEHWLLFWTETLLLLGAFTFWSSSPISSIVSSCLLVALVGSWWGRFLCSSLHSQMPVLYLCYFYELPGFQ